MARDHKPPGGGDVKASRIPPVRPNLVAGIDVGGTKVNIVDSSNTKVHRYSTRDYSDMCALLEAYFSTVGTRPERIAIAWAGPRDDETGEVTPTNFTWPPFKPLEADKRYPGTTFETVHDLAGAVAGALHTSTTDLLTLKPGVAKKNGPIIAVTIGTGVGVCAAISVPGQKQRVFFSGEPGHMGFQPYTEAERRHLAHLFTKYDHPSIELAVNGKHGIKSWLEHSPELNQAPELQTALDRAEAGNRPAGNVLRAFAIEGRGADRNAARTILNNMGSLVGNVIADIALAFRSTGGIYLTGSVCLGLADYWAEHTDFNKAFVRHGTTDHATWKKDFFESIPIYLLTNPDITAFGAMEIARDF